MLHAKRFRRRPEIRIDAGLIRQAAWQELAIDISYVDVNRRATRRRAYPLSIVYPDDVLVMVAYCCLRQATRVFRLDRIRKVKMSDESFYPRRLRLLRQALKDIGATG